VYVQYLLGWFNFIMTLLLLFVVVIAKLEGCGAGRVGLEPWGLGFWGLVFSCGCPLEGPGTSNYPPLTGVEGVSQGARHCRALVLV
jgi:hypothetical protein